MKFGASSWPFQWEPPYEDCIRRVAGLGFKAIELIGWNAGYLKDYYTPPKINDLKRLPRQRGTDDLAVRAHPARPVACRQGQARRRGRPTGSGRSRSAAELGSPSSSTWCRAHPFAMRDTVEIPRITTKPLVQKYATRGTPVGVDWDQNFKDYVAALRACAEACAAAGITMTVEPHPGRYIANHDGALRLLEHVDSPAMGINFDPRHTFPMGDYPNISVYRLGKHIMHLHVSDNDGVTNVHWRPGEGKIDWMAMFAGAQGDRLRRRGVDRARGRAGRVARAELERAGRLPQRHRDRRVRRRDGGRDELPQGHLQGARHQGRGLIPAGRGCRPRPGSAFRRRTAHSYGTEEPRLRRHLYRADPVRHRTGASGQGQGHPCLRLRPRGRHADPASASPRVSATRPTCASIATAVISTASTSSRSTRASRAAPSPRSASTRRPAPSPG